MALAGCRATTGRSSFTSGSVTGLLAQQVMVAANAVPTNTEAQDFIFVILHLECFEIAVKRLF